MEATCSLFCRWCSKKFECISSRYRHEKIFHAKEREANVQKYLLPDSKHFVKCKVCSIYTSRDLFSIAAHNTSPHHTSSQSNKHEQHECETRSSSSTFSSVSAPLPYRAQDFLSAYPRLSREAMSDCASAAVAVFAGAANTAVAATAANTVVSATAANTAVAAAAASAKVALLDPETEKIPEVANGASVAALATAAAGTTEPAANKEATTPTPTAAVGSYADLANHYGYIVDDPDYRYPDGNFIFVQYLQKLHNFSS